MTTVTESTLKNKSNPISYHAVREGVATGKWLTGYEPTDTNVSVLLKKPVPGGERRTHLVWGVMYYIFIGLVVGFHSLGVFKCSWDRPLKL